MRGAIWCSRCWGAHSGSVSSGVPDLQKRAAAGSRRSISPVSAATMRSMHLLGALAIPVATEPHLASFSPEGVWRGETHRVCDRPGALARLLEEVALAGAEQVILVSASAPPGRAHELEAGRGDLRGPRRRAAWRPSRRPALRDVLAAVRWPLRRVSSSSGRRTIRSVRSTSAASTTNAPIARSRWRSCIDRGYEDAYRQFIEPVVGAGGERIEASNRTNGGAGRNVQL